MYMCVYIYIVREGDQTRRSGAETRTVIRIIAATTVINPSSFRFGVAEKASGDFLCPMLGELDLIDRRRHAAVRGRRVAGVRRGVRGGDRSGESGGPAGERGRRGWVLVLALVGSRCVVQLFGH